MTTQEQIVWRRAKVLSLLAEGMNQAQVATELRLSPSVISDDVKALREESKARVQDLLDERLPFYYEVSLQTLKDLKHRAYTRILHKFDRESNISLTTTSTTASSGSMPSHPKLYMECLRLVADIEKQIVDVESHNGAIKAAMTFAKNAKNQLNSREKKQQQQLVSEEIEENKDKEEDIQSNNQVIVTSDNNDTTGPAEDDGYRESETAEDTADSDATTTDRTTEEDSRVF
jgi:predicted transcriptional regulator